MGLNPPAMCTVHANLMTLFSPPSFFFSCEYSKRDFFTRLHNYLVSLFSHSAFNQEQVGLVNALFIAVKCQGVK